MTNATTATKTQRTQQQQRQNNNLVDYGYDCDCDCFLNTIRNTNVSININNSVVYTNWQSSLVEKTWVGLITGSFHILIFHSGGGENHFWGGPLTNKFSFVFLFWILSKRSSIMIRAWLDNIGKFQLLFPSKIAQENATFMQSTDQTFISY